MDTDEFLRRLDELIERESAHSEAKSRPLRLLPGEDPASPFPEDARQWSVVYNELVTFKEELVGRLQAEQGQVSPAAQAELHKDELGLHAELERLRLHLRYWEERRRDAEANGELW